jgi:hypothetical protein
VVAVWHAARDRRTPWAVRLLALLVAAYALSPIDLIPDVVPVRGYLDDLLLAGSRGAFRRVAAPSHPMRTLKALFKSWALLGCFTPSLLPSPQRQPPSSPALRPCRQVFSSASTPSPPAQLQSS